MTENCYMSRALELAFRGRFTSMPNPNVGCVIVQNGSVVGEGWHHRTGEMHAEINALKMAGNRAKGATAYVTLEPCSHYGKMPPCCEALISAGIRKVVVAMKDPNPLVSGCGIYHLQKAGIEIIYGVMLESAEELNRGFLKRMRTGFPWVQIKFGSSIDGRTALKNGESKWITSSIARHDVQILRAQSSAILTSSATILRDDPLLTVRWNELKNEIYNPEDDMILRQPVRIVIDGQQRVTINHKIVNQPGEIWLIRKKIDKQSWPNNVKQILIKECDRYLNLLKIMKLLGQLELNIICVECGGNLAGSLLKAKLVDEIIIYFSPSILGNNAKGLFQLPNLQHLNEAPKLKFSDIRKIGPDLRVVLRPC